MSDLYDCNVLVKLLFLRVAQNHFAKHMHYANAHFHVFSLIIAVLSSQICSGGSKWALKMCIDVFIEGNFHFM